MKELIGINDIEKLILLGDEVLDEVTFSNSFYDYKGYPVYHIGVSIEEQRNLNRMQMENEEQNLRVYKIIRNKNYSLADARGYRAEELLTLVDSFKTKIIGIFRGGANLMGNTPYCVDDTVTDEYLLELFAMRLRDRMIIFSLNRD